LVLAKPFKGIQLIVMGKILYWLVRRMLCLLFWNTFSTHLSPPLVQHCSYKKVQNNGAWYLGHFGCSPWMGGVVGGCCECFWHNILYGYILRTPCDGQLVVT
jgi:3-hydroxymyristoyl/3-hydroxydecanoyl-(acyl carrier protein) dehydratase